MAITAATRTQLIGLSVAMLGQAPGTGRLNHWVADIDDDAMSVDDLANHIAESEAFQSEYPAFLTSMEFAEAFLGNVLYGLDDAAMTAAVELVSGMLDSGLSRGSLALAVVDALHDIAMQGMDHPAYDGLGMSAMVMYNKVHVASHYTLDARMEDPSSDVLANVTADADSAAMAIEAIDNPPAPPMEPEMAQRFVLTPTIDAGPDFTGGDADDTFVAAPERGADGLFHDVLNAFDELDGGAGNDTIHISGVNRGGELRLGAENISNIENVIIRTVGGIDADLRDYDGLQMVDLQRFGSDSDVTVIVDDGAMVGTSQAFGGDVTIVGSMGAVDIEASSGSAVHIGSAGQTGSVMVKGGASVDVDNGAGKQSETVTMVSLDGVQRDLGGNGVRGGQSKDTKDVPVENPNFDSDAEISPMNRQYLQPNPDKESVPFYKTTAAVDSNSNDMGWYDSIEMSMDTDTPPHNPDSPEETAAIARYNRLTTNDPAKAATEEKTTTTSDNDDGASVHILSNSIEAVHLSNNDAIVLVNNDSKVEDEDGKMKASPEDLAVTVDHYGGLPGQGAGKLCIDGAGSAENISINVVDDSNFALASNKVKMIDIMGDGKLTLDVNKFKATAPDDGPSQSLEMIMVAGETGLTMNIHGHHKLQSVDASGSSGANNLTSYDPEDKTKASTMLRSLEMVTTGSGKDSVSLNAGGATGKLEMVSTGEGDDKVTIAGAHRAAGLMVDLGDGNDFYSAGADNKNSRIDAGDGMDILHLTHGSGATYRGEDKMLKSIYENFERLEIGGGRGTYDLGLLGIDSGAVSVSASTRSVTLKNMSDGMGIYVSGMRGTDATRDPSAYGTQTFITHQISDRKPGESRYSGDLEVSLVANGFKDAPGSTSGEAYLSLTPDEDTGTLYVSSNANPNAATGVTELSSADYRNRIFLNEVAGLEEIFVTGNAGLSVGSNANSSLGADFELLDASGNSGGVVFDASAIGGSDKLEIFGGSGEDNFTAASGRTNIISGGGSGDRLAAGDGKDTFEYGAASESRLMYDPDGSISSDGYDSIWRFNGEGGTGPTDVISLGRSLFGSLGGKIKTSEFDPDGDGDGLKLGNSWTIDSTDNIQDAQGQDIQNDQGNTTRRIDNDNLDVFIRTRADGFFETTTPTSDGFGGSTNHHSVALVKDMTTTYLSDGSRLEVHWLFIDVDGDGDFNAETDMVIEMIGMTGSLAAGDGGNFSA